jgi:hypothetical protein
MNTQSYIYKAPGYLKTYDLTSRRIFTELARRPLVADYGEQWIHALLAETRSEFARLIPEIPFIGEKNIWESNLVMATIFLATYRVLKQRGWSTHQIGEFLFQEVESLIHTYPAWQRSLNGRIQFSRWQYFRLAQGARQSREDHNPHNWVFDLIPGDGDFDYGLNIYECAILKFFQNQGAKDLTPYLCSIDHQMAYAMGYQFRRKGTLANGAQCCDCRYKQAAVSKGWLENYQEEKGQKEIP